MRVWRERKSCPRGGEESQGSTATARRRREESIFDRSGEASCRPYPPVPHAGPEGAGAAAFFLESAPAFLARTRRDSETGFSQASQMANQRAAGEAPGRLPATIPCSKRTGARLTSTIASAESPASS